MKKLIVLLLLLVTSSVYAQTRDFTRWVNPFIGTGGHGHTFPGATLPFGMVQLSPDTRVDNWDGSSGYHYSDDVIYGFSHTHLSGTGIPDGCDILFMPTIDLPKLVIDQPQFNAGPGDRSVNGIASTFSHAKEKAEPGYYSVMLDDDGILAELTTTTRVGFHRYTFPKTPVGVINLDLEWRDKLLASEIWFKGDRRIEGMRRSSSWAKDQKIYFAAEFSKPIKDVTQNVGLNDDDVFEMAKHTKAAFRFDTSDGNPILLKVAISYVSIEGARKNLEAELPGWDFDRVRADAKAAWNKELSKIEVSGGTDDQTTIFYTALYHTMIHPNVFNDVDGNYKGHDGKIHSLRHGDAVTRGPGDFVADESPRRRVSPSPGRDKEPRREQNQYTVFSLWDTFRAAHPLYTIIDQKRTVDFINTFIRIYEQGGRLPVWELWGEETDTMIGYHAVSVIADAMSKGIEGFDYEKAYKAAKHSAELDHFGLAAYKKRGYVSSEDDNESASKTLEYAYDDWCIYQMAYIVYQRRVDRHPLSRATLAVGNEGVQYAGRARNFENLFDSRVDFFVPRKNGGFIRPFAPNEVTFNFTEGNSWVYSFFVPHDMNRLIDLMGGRERFADKLDDLFTTEQKLIGREQPDITGLIGQYAHGNEPSHHIPYLFNYAGQSWKTQKYVRKIMDEFYKNAPDGLIGNEDCGQMSAWFVLSASGFYPVAPGAASYAIGTPLFREVKFKLENGRNFTVRANNVSDKNFYIRSASLNGKPLKVPTLEHSELVRGGVLEFEMADKTFASTFSEAPATPSPIETVAVPRIEIKSAVFMATATPGAKIYFTLDGSEPSSRSQEYVAPFRLRPRETPPFIRAVAIDGKGNKSFVVEANQHTRPNDWKVLSTSGYSYQYTGGGDDAIVDGLRGTVNFTAGEWQGYQGKTFEAVIDMQRETPVSSVGGSFLQAARSWIWMPDRVEFEISQDGVTFTRVAEIKPNFPQQEMEPTAKEFTQAIKPTSARYVRVRAYNIGKIPSWHPGAGGDPWIFVDEILIR